ncbi:ABC transporter permease [Chloroflexota bacterium]
MITRRLLMFRLARRYIVRRLLQSALFVIGVAVGVAVGIAIDLANTSAQQAFSLSAQSINGRATHQIVGGSNGLPVDLYTQLRVNTGIRASAPLVESTVNVVELADQPVRLLGVDVFAEAPFRDYLSTTQIAGSNQPAFDTLSRFLAVPDSVLISASLADKHGLALGDTLTLRTNAQQIEVSIVGLLQPQDDSSAQALETLMLADIATAQEILAQPDTLTRIDLILPEDYDLTALEALLPPDTRLTTPAASTAALKQMTAAFDLNLRALSLLALIVGVFLIYNTVTFSVIQRRPVIGIMRSLGMTQRQIFTMILGEALLLGSLGTVLGLALGIIMGRLVVGLIAQTINDLYFAVTVTRVTVQPTSLLVGAIIGLGASTIAALIPSWEATRTPPAGIMRRSAEEENIRRIMPLMVVGAVILIGAGLLVLTLSTSSVVVGFLALFLIVVGCTLLTPLALVIFLRAIMPLVTRWGGVIGRIAVRDLRRSLSRTAVAVAALTIAVSVIVGVGVMIGSFRNTVDDWLLNTLGADIFISPPSTAGTRITANLDPALVNTVAATESITTVTTVRNVTTPAPDYPDLPPVNLSAITHDIAVQRRFAWNNAPGGNYWQAMQTGAILVTEPFAYRRGITPDNNTITLLTADGPHTFTVIGVYYDYATDQGTITLFDGVYRQHFNDPYISSLGAYVAENASLPDVIDRLRTDTLAGQDLTVQSNRSLRTGALEVFERTFSVTVALQALATIVAFIGILSALLALQLEHTREFAIMRANGMTTRQLWQLTLTQTGLMGTVAGLLAIPIGLVLAVVLIEVINVRSFGWSMQLAFTPGEFLRAFGVAVVSALLAGIYPAWRLSRMEVTEGLRAE